MSASNDTGRFAPGSTQATETLLAEALCSMGLSATFSRRAVATAPWMPLAADPACALDCVVKWAADNPPGPQDVEFQAFQAFRSSAANSNSPPGENPSTTTNLCEDSESSSLLLDTTETSETEGPATASEPGIPPAPKGNEQEPDSPSSFPLTR